MLFNKFVFCKDLKRIFEKKTIMHYIDIVILIPLLWGAYRGFMKGFIVAISTFLALMLGVYGAINFSNYVSTFLFEKFNWTNEYIPIIAFAITFIGIVILIHFLSRLLDNLVKAVALGFVNKILGAILGMAKFMLIISVVILIINKFDKNSSFITEKIKTESLLYSPISSMILKAYPSVEKLNIESIKQKINNVTESTKSL
jgi:membrane protein required for colicin V production